MIIIQDIRDAFAGDDVRRKNIMLAKASAEIERWCKAENALGIAYLRLRGMIPGALKTPHAPTSEQVWETTEKALEKMCAEIDRLHAERPTDWLQVAEIEAELRRNVEAQRDALFNAIRNSDNAHWTPAMRTAMDMSNAYRAHATASPSPENK